MTYTECTQTIQAVSGKASSKQCQNPSWQGSAGCHISGAFSAIICSEHSLSARERGSSPHSFESQSASRHCSLLHVRMLLFLACDVVLSGTLL